MAHRHLWITLFTWPGLAAPSRLREPAGSLIKPLLDGSAIVPPDFRGHTGGEVSERDDMAGNPWVPRGKLPVNEPEASRDGSPPRSGPPVGAGGRHVAITPSEPSEPSTAVTARCLDVITSAQPDAIASAHQDAQATMSAVATGATPVIPSDKSLVVNLHPSGQAAKRVPGKTAGTLHSGAVEGDRNAAKRRPGGAQPGHGGSSPGPETRLTTWHAADQQRVDSLVPHRRIPAWTEPVHPHLGGLPGELKDASWWWLGVHGGSGVSTLMRFLPGGADAHRWWPDPVFGGPHTVVLVCRTHLSGLDRARDAAMQWAASDVPTGLSLAGAVAVADAPGRLDRPQAEATRLLEAIVPRLWTVPWLDELRCLAPDENLPFPSTLLDLRTALEALHTPTATTAGQG